MGKPTGFIEYARRDRAYKPVEERTRHFREFIIPLDEQEHIFEKFRQGSTAPGGRDHVKREYEGTGLGLSIVRELSRLLGGDVRLQSEFGKGSLFVVRLPIRAGVRKGEQAIVLESRSGSGLGRITSVDLMNTPPSPENSSTSANAESGSNGDAK